MPTQYKNVYNGVTLVRRKVTTKGTGFKVSSKIIQDIQPEKGKLAFLPAPAKVEKLDKSALRAKLAAELQRSL